MARPLLSLALRSVACLALAFVASPAWAGYGLKTDSAVYEVDTGAGLIVTVSRTNGDITSLIWEGTELNSSKKKSQIGSGLGSATVSARVFKPDDTILITAETPTLTQYYAFRKNQALIGLATFITEEPRVGELRWITRLQRDKFDRVPEESRIEEGVGNVESRDVFKLADGQTRSKYYGNQQAKDLTLRGITGPGRGVFMVYGNRESSSGGPFFRDIQNQTGEQAEVYNYMNSGHLQTEPVRMGLHGPYALCFTHGEAPPLPDLDFMQDLGLRGWIAARGRVAGQTSGTLSGVPVTIGWANASAQYWTAGPDFTSPPMKPGVYTQTLYQGELAVATRQTEVLPGKTVRADLSSSFPPRDPVWRIGVWDGTPCEFANGKTFPLRHPSDPRNAPWPATFTLGDDVSGFPSAQWAGVNTPLVIRFRLDEKQVAAHTLLIGITTAYARGRPSVQMNAWSAPLQKISNQPKSRSLTIGSYRGNNTTYTFAIPAGAFKVGVNVLSLGVTGLGDFSDFLSPGFAYDCLELD
jgi:rhamnogalacturonan endolyase